MSWKPEVQTGTDPKWYDNALRFATKEEAEQSACALMWRWTAVVDYRASESDDPVNYAIVDNKEVRLESEHDLQVNALFDNKKGLTP